MDLVRDRVQLRGQLTSKPTAVAILAGAVSLCACTTTSYESVGRATVTGTLEVRWVKPDRFIYSPSAQDPLVVVTSDRRTIKPGRMYTDGGSIPRMFWGIPGLSPWGYAPGYIVHDWVFQAHHCNLPEYKDVTFDDSARYLAEAIKALMETNVAPKDEATLLAIYAGVRTPIARSVWDRAGQCIQPEALGVPVDEGEVIQVIRIPPKR